jgi:ParB family chromosome partitioning protein
MSEVIIEDFKRDMPMSLIEGISKGNVRQSQQGAGLEALKTSIQNFGLIHPVIVIPKDKRYKLLVGQRRFLAFQSLKKTTIPAIIIRPMSLKGERIVSFGENIQRRQLPYDDTIRVCEQLYNETSGPKSKRIEKIAKSLGIGLGTVSTYLAYKLVPPEVRKMVSGHELSADRAYRITSAFWPNTKKIIKIANYATSLSKPELLRALDIGKKNAELLPEDIIEEAKKPPPPSIVISVDRDSYDLLTKIAAERKTGVSDLVKSVIDDFLKEELEE